MTSVRLMLGLVAVEDLELEQLDVKTAFLHGELEEDIYMEQPLGFIEEGKEGLVCKLNKSLYGLKQAPRQWYRKFDSFMLQNEFRRTLADHCVFIKRFDQTDFIILLLYVDDMLVMGNSIGRIKELKQELNQAFEMKDLGKARCILGMEIKRDRKQGCLWLSQERYINKVLERFNMADSKPVSSPLGLQFKLSEEQCALKQGDIEKMAKIPYSSAVGSLMYAMICTRPDIAFTVGVLSRYLASPGLEHWEAVKWLLRYLRGSTNLSLCYGRKEVVLEGFSDADMAGDPDTKRSTSGYLFTYAGGAIAWQSKRQKCVALSTTEAEYIAVTEACKELLWLKRFCKEVGITQGKFYILCDSQSAIHLCKNPSFHSKSKHIQVRYHWIRDVLEDKQLELKKVNTDDNGSDMLTKALPRGKHEVCCKISGLEIVQNEE